MYNFSPQEFKFSPAFHAHFFLHGTVAYKVLLRPWQGEEKLWSITADGQGIALVRQWLMAYAAGHELPFIEVAYTVPPFTRTVLEATRRVPYGTTLSYKELAIQLGCDKAYRAVARALSINPTPLIVPCHRVIASDGTLGGFLGKLTIKNLAIKKKLISFESKILI
jgi:O-6-methylguanine DNA methyltransferase